MEKQIFKVGDKVYHIYFGWGHVFCNDSYDTYPLLVTFANGECESFSNCGRSSITDLYPTLSFTEYTLQGFSQERPINWEELKGKWCKFWDKVESGKSYGIYKSNGIKNQTSYGLTYDFCEPFTDEVIKLLNLD